MSAKEVIKRLGGMKRVSHLLGHRNHTTVQGWWDRDVIPARRQSEILSLAAREGVAIEAVDLMPSPPGSFPADDAAPSADEAPPSSGKTGDFAGQPTGEAA